MDERIIKFISRMHLLSLAVISENKPYSASSFYAFDNLNFNLIVAGKDDTRHIKMALDSNFVSGTIALDTKIIGRIEGVQFNGNFSHSSKLDENIYFSRFPYALMLKPQLFTISLEWVKFTSNTFGFGKKIIWQR